MARYSIMSECEAEVGFEGWKRGWGRGRCWWETSPPMQSWVMDEWWVRKSWSSSKSVSTDEKV